MGVVWEAEDQALQVRVALKEIWVDGLAEAVRNQLMARAVREARSMVKLRGHPHMVTGRSRCGNTGRACQSMYGYRRLRGAFQSEDGR